MTREILAASTADTRSGQPRQPQPDDARHDERISGGSALAPSYNATGFEECRIGDLAASEVDQTVRRMPPNGLLNTNEHADLCIEMH
jgi:hypothetical protein